MNLKRFFLIINVIFSLSIPVFSQENSSSTKNVEESEKTEDILTIEDLTEKVDKKKSKLPGFIEGSRFILGLTPGFYINPNSNELKSAPTAPIYPFYIGFVYPDNYFIAVEPTISFFTMYSLWNDGTAYPAEIENRTATTLSFLLNIPIVFSLNIKKIKFQLYPGIAFLMRYGIRSGGLYGSDSGFSGSVDSDLTLINQWYWSNARFLYFSTGVNIIFENVSHVKIGPVLNFYVPVGTIFSGESIQGMIISAGMKLSF